MRGLDLLSLTCCLALASPLAGCAGSGGSACLGCDDGIACTEDRCLESTGQCSHDAQAALCPAGQVCDPLAGCVTPGACTADTECDDGNSCTVDRCAGGQCSHQNTCACESDADCDDDDPCTADRCSGGQCSHSNSCACESDGDCDDGNPCTDDACVQGVCGYQDNSASCDDGDSCTEQDVCSAGQCAGQPVDCDDGNPCTDDACAPGSGCSHTANAATCDDGDACTVDEACQEGDCLGAEGCCGDGQDNDGDGQTDCGDPDCAADSACSACQPVAAPDPVPMAPLPGEAVPGRSETTGINGYQDDYIYDSNDLIKVGTRREWGGTIVFFGQNVNDFPGINTTNTIDANDTGREVQVAFYDPDRRMQNCAWDASCQSSPTECPNSITYLGWNPVQGGNRCNRGSGVEAVDSQNGVLTVTTNPLFWNPNWDSQTCSDAACDDPALRERRSDVRVIQRLRFVRTHVVELQYTLINLADLDHASTGQEMPTVYTANSHGGTQDLWRLFNSEGTEIAIDVPGNDGFFYKNFTSPGGWATLQNGALNYGVGLYTENRLTGMQGWQNRDLPFNNFRPLFPFAIPAQGTVMARSYLLIGSQATIAAEAAWLDANLAPFGWLDAPEADAAVSGPVTVRGWVLDNKGVSAVDVLVDGQVQASLGTGLARPDVCLVWPAYPQCPNVGYSGTLDTSGLSACQHLIEIRASDTDGNQRIIARQRITVAD